MNSPVVFQFSKTGRPNGASVQMVVTSADGGRLTVDLDDDATFYGGLAKNAERISLAFSMLCPPVAEGPTPVDTLDAEAQARAVALVSSHLEALRTGGEQPPGIRMVDVDVGADPLVAALSADPNTVPPGAK